MDINLVQKLVNMMQGSDLSALEVETPGIRVRLERKPEHGVVDVQKQQHVQVLPPESSDTPDVPPPHKNKYVTAPVVGIFRSLKSLNKGDVKQGSHVSAGQVVCAIEAMKLINEVESDFAGVVARVMVSDGDAVEYGQPLIEIADDAPVE